MNTFSSLCHVAQALAWRHDLHMTVPKSSPFQRRAELPSQGEVRFGSVQYGISVSGDSRKAELTWRTENGSLVVSCVDGELDSVSMMGIGGRLLEKFIASWCRTVGRET